jgi:hypothetical protein
MPVRGGEFEYQPTDTPNWIEHFRLKRRDRQNKNSHLLWEFKAVKAR